MIFLGGAGWRWPREGHYEYILAHSIQNQTVALMNTFDANDVTMYLLGLRDIRCRWEELSSRLRAYLIEAIYQIIFREGISGEMSSTCLLCLHDIGALRRLSPRYGDRLMVYVSRHAEAFDVSSIIRIASVLHLTPTGNKRMLSYLCRRLVGLVLSRSQSAASATTAYASLSRFSNNNIIAKTNEKNFLGPSTFQLLLTSLCAANIELPLLSTYSSMESRLYQQECELRQSITSMTSQLIHSMKPNEIISIITSLHQLGIQWSEFSMDQLVSISHAIENMIPFITVTEALNVRNILHKMDDFLKYPILSKIFDRYDIVLSSSSSMDLDRIVSSVLSSQIEPSIIEGVSKSKDELLSNSNKLSGQELKLIDDSSENSVNDGVNSALHRQQVNTLHISDSFVKQSLQAASNLNISKYAEKAMDDSNWSTLEDLRCIIPSLKEQNLANTMWLCVTLGHTLDQLQVI